MLAAAFVIGFLTVVLVVPGAHREVWSGRVPGLNVRRLAWPARHSVLSGLAAGFMASAFLGVPFILAMDKAGFSEISPGQVVWFKATFDACVGVAVAVLAAFAAILPEPTVPLKSHECDVRAPAQGPVYPLDYFDKGALSVSDNARGCNGTPTWTARRGHLGSRARPDGARGRGRPVSVARDQVRATDGVPPWAAHYQYSTTPPSRSTISFGS